MEQLTVRGFGDELGAAVRDLADRERISLNQAALRLLRRGAGLEGGRGNPKAVGTSLDHLIGSWTAEEADEFDAALEDLQNLDEDLWT
ncbi:hypothetical protein [Candidatus Poriferisocius sp.]|uniref:hypothetical protein n=1 Tax=Candidatus Poriferisocius sp. TaxID=3101276 RepID=UPI003B5BA995